MSKVSVIIPSHNRARTIRRAIDSVLAQLDIDFELIVVDDGSNDGTCDIVSTINDSRITLIKNAQRLGGAGARNVGIRAAAGDIIAFQDSDDEWLTQKLQIQLDLLQQDPNLSACYCGFIKLSADRVERFPGNFSALHDETTFTQLMVENLISTQTFLAKKDALLKIGLFDENLPKLQDWDLVLRFSEKFKIGFIADPLVIVYDTPGNLSSFKKNEIFAREAILKKWIGHPQFTRSMEAWHCYVISRLAMRAGEREKARAFAQQASFLQPSNMRYRLALLQTLFCFKTPA